MLLLIRVRCQSSRQVWHANPVGHSVRDQIRGHRPHRVLGSRGCAQQLGSHRLWRQDGGGLDGWRLRFLDHCPGDYLGACPDRRGQDLLEPLRLCDLLDALEVLVKEKKC